MQIKNKRGDIRDISSMFSIFSVSNHIPSCQVVVQLIVEVTLNDPSQIESRGIKKAWLTFILASMKVI